MSDSQRPRIFNRLGSYMHDDDEKRRWLEFIGAIHERVTEMGIEDEILFHGTSTQALERILAHGMKPVEIEFALPCEDIETIGEHGSFWGTIETAAYFSEDTVQWRHEGTSHVILAIPVSALERNAVIRPDAAMVQMPVSRPDDEVEAEWMKDDCELGWRECLRDWGAIVAIHDRHLDPSEISIINSMDDFNEIADMIMNNKKSDRSRELAL